VSDFRYVAHWQTELPDENESVLAFWKAEGAIGDEAQARQRLKEIVLHARDADNVIAGVCTAVAVTLPRIGQPMYYYRCFIAPRWRKSRLILYLFKRAYELLEGHAVRNDYPCIGVLAELENTRFTQMGRIPVWPDCDLVFIGVSQRGHDLRVRYFRGAKLKEPVKR
jgi:hypothetical protein